MEIQKKITPSVSVIIPVYNAGKYISLTAESLFCQSLQELEYVFVDDGSTDNSVELILSVLERFEHRQKWVKIIPSSSDHKNSGVAKARQTGLDASTGEYIIFCDADDTVDNDYYESLYNVAIQNKADMAVGSHSVERANGKRLYKAPDIKNWQEFLSYHEWIHLSLCNRLIRRSLIKEHNIKFFEGINFSEDYGFVIIVYYHSRCNCVAASNSTYHYNKENENSLTTIVPIAAHLQRIQCIQVIDDFFKQKGCKLNNCKIHVTEKKAAKDSLLLFNDFRLWKRTFPEVAINVLEDKERNFMYKIAYISGQYLSWRILWLYHYLSGIRR